MRRSATGPRRLKAGLPASTPVAHRTGMSATIDGLTGAVNDVGVITLGNGRHAVVAVFVKGTERPVADADAAIASIARRIWDYWGPPAAR